MSWNYDDIVNMSRPVSKKHIPMDIEKRAAQFAPFSALTGYEDSIDETGRLTDRRIELDENEKMILDEKMSEIINNKDASKEINITFFVPDERKEGGKYVTACGQVKKVDIYKRTVELSSKEVISIDDIFEIRGSDTLTDGV